MPCVPPDSARLIPAPKSLRGCVRACVVRNTLALDDLPLAQRFNRFPAMGLCGITWLLQGRAVLVHSGGQACDWPLPACFVSGPQRHPFVSFNEAPIHAFSLVLYPEAFAALTGLRPDALLNRHQVGAEALGPDWQALDEPLRQAAGDDARMACIEAFLAPRWQACGSPGRLALLRHAVQQMGIQAAARWMGWTTRHLERRSHQLYGLRPGELKRLERAEQAWRSVSQAPAPRLADVAQAHGFADQSHMTRELRRVTGLSPSQLYQQVRSGNESLWVFRLKD